MISVRQILTLLLSSKEFCNFFLAPNISKYWYLDVCSQSWCCIVLGFHCPSGSKVTIDFDEFLAIDFWSYKNHLKRVYHISFLVETTEITEYSLYWLEVLLLILTTFCGTHHIRVSKTPLHAMQRHLSGHDCINGMTDYRDELEKPKL